MIMPIATEHKIMESFEQFLLIRGFLFVCKNDFSGRAGAMADAYIDFSVENLDREIEETVKDNAPDNNDVDETKVPRGKSIAHHILFNKAVF